MAAQGPAGGGKPGRGGAQLRHTHLHRGPLNEDVFSAPSCMEEKGLHPGVQELTEQIHRLLLQVGASSARLLSPCVSGPGLPGDPGCPSLPLRLLPLPMA